MRAAQPAAQQAHNVIAARYSEFANAIERHEYAWGIGEIDDPLIGRQFLSAQTDSSATRL